MGQPTDSINTVKAKKLVLPPNDMMPLPKGIGLVAPFDFALDSECLRWLPTDVSLFVTRTPRLEDTSVTIELAKEVGGEAAVAPAVQSLISAGPSAIGYACTSGSFVGGVSGERELQATMQAAGALPGVTTSGALVQALKQVNARKVAIATPYNEELTSLLADYLTQAGFEVVSSGYLDLEEGIARVGYDAVRGLAHMVDHPDADAIFFSCTNLRTFDIIQELETELGKTILSANQVTIWATLKAGGIEMPDLPQNLFRS